MPANIKLICIGNPIVDELVHVESDFLVHAGGQKGGMELVDHQVLEDLTAKLTRETTRAAGGCAGNTAYALARLGTSSAMIGKLGDDSAGRFYQRRFAEVHAVTDRFLLDHELPTGRCLCLVTPDSERTMRTHLGAAMTLSPEDINEELFAGAGHVHVEGYLLFNPDLIRKVLHVASAGHRTVSLDLASFEVVQAAGAELATLLRDYVDIVFANEEEATAFADHQEPQHCVAQLAAHCRIAVVKVGERGAFIHAEGTLLHVPAEKVNTVMDTTGAGDFWNAGFLHGYLNGADLSTSGRMGAHLGALVVQHLGAKLPAEYWQRARARFDEALRRSAATRAAPEELPALDEVPDQQEYGDDPTAMRNSAHYTNEYVMAFVDKWDELIDWDQRAQSEGDFFLNILRKHGKRSVLDVATGTGFHSVRLIEAGFDVVSADGSPTMLAKAFYNGQKRGHILRTAQADWRFLNRDIHGEFDAIICLGNSFTHLHKEKDRRKALAEYYAMLKHDGILILDQRNYDSILDEGFSSAHKYYYCGDEVTAEPEYVDEGLARFRYQFNDGSVYHLNMFPLRKSYVRRLMQEVGFQTVETFGDFQSSYHDKDPDFFVHVAQKSYMEED